MLLYKIFSKFISILIIFILLCGNLLSCTVKTNNENIQEIELNNIFLNFGEGSWTSSSVNSWTVLSEDSWAILSEGVFTDEAKADFITFLEDEFQIELDDIFLTYLSLNELESIRDIIDPERKLDVDKIANNLAIGGGIILVTFLIALIPGMPAVAATILITTAKTALAVSVIDAAVNGAIVAAVSYLENDGDPNAVLYDALEGASEGFMYGAIFNVSGGAVFNAGSKAIKNTRIIKNLLPIFNKLSRAEKDAIKALTREGENPVYRNINSFQRTGRTFDGRKSLSRQEKKILKNASKGLNKMHLTEEIVLFRGIHVDNNVNRWLGNNILDSNGRISFQKLKMLEGKEFIDNGFIHTSTSPEIAWRFAERGNNPVLMRIKMPKGTKGGWDLGDNTHFKGELEIMMSPGKKLKFDKVNMDEFGGITVDVLMGALINE